MISFIKLLPTRDKVMMYILIIFIGMQVTCDLYLPELISKIIGLFELDQVTKEYTYPNPGQIWLAVAYAVMALAGSTIGVLMVGIFSTYISANYSRCIKAQFFNKVMKFSIVDINNFSIASLVNRGINDINGISNTFQYLLKTIITAPAMIVGGALKTLLGSTQNNSDGGIGNTWPYTLIIVGGAVLIAFVFTMLIVFTLQHSKKRQAASDELNEITREIITGVRVIRAYNAESYHQARFVNANKKFTKHERFLTLSMSVTWPFLTLIMSVTAFLIYGVGAYFMSIGVALSYSQLFNYALLATFILRSTVNLVELIRQLPSSIILSRRVNEVIRFQPSIHDDKKPVMDFSKRGILEFKNVDFRFAKSKENVLSGINFKINQGQVVGIIGSTGSGKSTLMNLIPRTFDVTSGQILVDGVDIRKIPNEILHSKISVVPQKTFLFSDTIKQNIAFGLNSNDPNDMVRIEEACKIACIAPFIEKLPNKYDSKISQNATNLSGGQKQRLAIARAIISHPEFLLFDDSFSALDLLTDRKINESLHANLKDSTIVIISQRISTILNADKIIVLEKGKVVGQGTHKELAAKCRVYQEIMQSQSVEEGGPHA